MDENDINHLRLARTVLTVASLHDKSDLIAYWHAQAPLARLEHMEWLRRLNYGAAATGRLQRVFAIAYREKD